MRIRRWWDDRLDLIAARVAIWGLHRIYTRCAPPYDPECRGCQAGEMCDRLQREIDDIKTAAW